MTSQQPNRKGIGLAFVGAGAAVLFLAVWGLIRDVAWIAQPFYAFAWWGYILCLDGFCVLRRNHSLFTTRTRLVLPLALCSISFWFFFELLNLRFQNWYYVGVFEIRNVGEVLLGGVFVSLCFSTVFLGIFETLEALTAAGFLVGWKGRPGRLPAWVSFALQGLGAAMASAALLFPYYLAPLIWGSVTFLIDPWNYRKGARSILRDLEARDWGLVARVFLAGLVCGVVWESFNFFAPQKWIYTVRGLENFKLFEMPLLGFLGFPGLAYDCLAAFAFLSYWLFGNVTWEHPGDLAYPVSPRDPAPRVRRIALAAVQPFFWAAVAYPMLFVTFGSVQLDLIDLGLDTTQREALESHGIRRPRQLLRAARDPEATTRIQATLELDAQRMQGLLERVELFVFKGIGSHYGEMLQEVGVTRVSDLRDRDPEELHRELRELALAEHLGCPRLDMVRVWTLAARDRGIVMRTTSADPAP